MKKKFMCICAHPDDADLGFGGTAMKLTKAGHIVQFLSVTNGQSGHHKMDIQELIKTRNKEAQLAKDRLSIDSYVILNNKDAYLTADIPTREGLMRAIRAFGPDIILTHRPNDYHPDHRNTGLLVQDCSYLVKVPKFLPDVPVPKVMPVIYYLYDSFMKPQPLNPEIVVDIDDVLDEKIKALDAFSSQVYDFLPWIENDQQNVPANPTERLKYLYNFFAPRWVEAANRFRDKLIEKYGKAHGSKVKHAEAFEACEYGSAHNFEEEKALFSF